MLSSLWFLILHCCLASKKWSSILKTSLTFDYDVVTGGKCIDVGHSLSINLRAAAARCRLKKKVWVTNLEQKAEDLQSANSRLQVYYVCLFSQLHSSSLLLTIHYYAAYCSPSSLTNFFFICGICSWSYVSAF